MTQRTRILELHAEGLNIIAIAGRMNLSRWYVRKVLDETPNKAAPLHRCLKCQYVWPVSSRSAKPVMCPSCRNRAWQRPKKPPSNKPKRVPHNKGATTTPNPTPEDIARETAEIRAKWSRTEHMRRAGIIVQHVEMRIISCADANIPTGAEDGGATDREKFWT